MPGSIHRQPRLAAADDHGLDTLGAAAVIHGLFPFLAAGETPPACRRTVRSLTTSTVAISGLTARQVRVVVEDDEPDHRRDHHDTEDKVSFWS